MESYFSCHIHSHIIYQQCLPSSSVQSYMINIANINMTEKTRYNVPPLVQLCPKKEPLVSAFAFAFAFHSQILFKTIPQIFSEHYGGIILIR